MSIAKLVYRVVLSFWIMFGFSNIFSELDPSLTGDSIAEFPTILLCDAIRQEFTRNFSTLWKCESNDERTCTHLPLCVCVCVCVCVCLCVCVCARVCVTGTSQRRVRSVWISKCGSAVDAVASSPSPALPLPVGPFPRSLPPLAALSLPLPPPPPPLPLLLLGFLSTDVEVFPVRCSPFAFLIGRVMKLQNWPGALLLLSSFLVSVMMSLANNIHFFPDNRLPFLLFFLLSLWPSSSFDWSNSDRIVLSLVMFLYDLTLTFSLFDVWSDVAVLSNDKLQPLIVIAKWSAMVVLISVRCRLMWKKSADIPWYPWLIRMVIWLYLCLIKCHWIWFDLWTRGF